MHRPAMLGIIPSVSTLCGGVETGGTWTVCAVATGPGDVRHEAEFRTALAANPHAQSEAPPNWAKAGEINIEAPVRFDGNRRGI